MIKAIINVTMYDYELFTEDAYLLFDKRILKTGKMSEFVDEGFQIIDGLGQLLLPNFVAGHTHVYSTFARGMPVNFNPKNFQEILDQLWWKLDRHLNNEMVYYSGIVSAVDFIKHGVTTLIDHHASGIDIEGSLDALKSAICEEASLRGAFAFETSDRFDIDAAVRENINFMSENTTDKTRGLFGLHASMSLSEGTLEKVKDSLGQHPIHIHVAESMLDQEDSLKKYGERVIHRLCRHGLITPGSILTHAIHVNDEELDLIVKHGGVIAVNPNSNMNNGVGLPDVKRFIKKGIPVIIGNDGISSAMATEYLSLNYAMHHLYKTPTEFDLSDLIAIIRSTYEYASKLFNIQLGRLLPDYEADIMMIPYQAPTPLNAENAFGHLFFGLFQSFKPCHVFVGGKHLLKDYQIEETLNHQYLKARQFAQRLWQNIEKEGM